MRARNCKISRDFTTGKWSVSFDIDRPEDIPQGELDLTIKPYKPKRSLSANAYMWVLVGKLADATGISSAEIYRNTVKQLGISQLIVINAAAAPAFKRAWEHYGLGWFVDDVDEDTGGSVILRAYYGSSTYNRKQMAALIDLVVQDCKQLGIETLTERELSLLCDRWEGERNGKVQGRAKHNAG